MTKEQLYLHDGQVKRKAKLCTCKECGKEWLIREDRENSSYCRDCLFKGHRNGMFGKISWNKGQKTYDRNSFKKLRKKECVALFGNKCALCGAENLPIACYSFHHIDPNTKQHQISKILLWNWVTLKNELLKCVMLCSNCHKQVHFGSMRLKNEN